MRILDRYILKSIIGILSGCLFTFVFLYIIIDLFSHLDTILKQHVGIKLLINYYLSGIPVIFVQVVPIACLLATLYTFAKLNRDNEVIAMRSSGLSIFQLSKTVLTLSLLISVFVFMVNDRMVPGSLVFSDRMKEQIEDGGKKQDHKQGQIIKNFSMFGANNRLFYANSFNTLSNTMEGIIILEHDNKQNVLKKIVADKGVYRNGVWIFYHCSTYNYENEDSESVYNEEESMTISESPSEFLNQGQKTDYMNISQLDNYIQKLAKSGATKVIRSLTVDLYQKFAIPLTCLIITLLGVPFSLMMRKRATGLSSLGISIMVGFLYYVLNAVSIAFGKQGFLPPFIAVFLSHMVALLFSFSMIYSLP